jgi:hypothetical protein
MGIASPRASYGEKSEADSEEDAVE